MHIFRYFRKPPSKRHNFLKLSIASPFKCPWQQLVNEWSTDTAINQFYVLRNKIKLHELEQYVCGRSKILPTDIDENCLISVSLTLNGRGMANKFSIICLPKRHDLKHNEIRLKQFDFKPVFSEPNGKDENESMRKQLRLKHLMMLKRLRRRRVRIKRKKQEYSERKVIIAPAKTAKLIANQLNQMCELWLPTNSKTIRHQCSREVFGYLTQCQFSFHDAKVAGIGYITFNGLRKLMKLNYGQKLNQVLVRDPNSINYRLATLYIRCI